MRRYALLALSAVLLTSGLAEAKTYSSAKEAALRQGAYRITRNTFVRNNLGVINRTRVTSRSLGQTAAGNPSYLVQTRKYLNGAPVSTSITVRQLKGGLWKPYSGTRINYVRKAQQNSGLGGRMVNLTVQAPISRIDSHGVPLVNQQAYTRAMAQLPSVHAANIARSPGTAVQQTTSWLRGQGFTIR